MRWLHVYLSMISLAVVLFFSVTGITLNHPDWFFDAAKGRRAPKAIWTSNGCTVRRTGRSRRH